MNTTEIDIKKACQMNKPALGYKNTHIIGPPRLSPSTSDVGNKLNIDNVKKQITVLKSRLERRNIKVSKVAEA